MNSSMRRALVAFLVGALGAAGIFVVKLTPTAAPIVQPMGADGIAAGVVPHHLVASALITDFFEKLSEARPSTVILVSPDHFGLARNYFTTTEREVIGDLRVDAALRRALFYEIGGEELGFDDTLIRGEHGVMNLLPPAARTMPRATVLPLAISAVVSEDMLDKVAAALNKAAPGDAVLVASVDFSHYLPSSAADLHDAKSRVVLEQFERASFRDLEVDCWQCLYLARAFAELRDASQSELIGHTNSAKLANAEAAVDQTTSYVSMIFEKGEPKIHESVATLLTVGDIMLGRNVEALMRKQGNDYPFEAIYQFFRGIDVVFANLEGSIPERHVPTPSGSTRFSFISLTPQILRKHGLRLVSLANNHALDHGAIGFAHTKEVLADARIDVVGHPTDVSEVAIVTKEIRGQEVTWIGFNGFYHGFDESESIELVTTQAADADRFVIITIHWGDEYQLRANRKQRELAHAFIDAGADLVIGHHPHVVQNVEVYKDRAIFYSLGNFIFDQYFSRETQEGLAVGIEVQDKKVIYRLSPIDIVRSQPQLMSQERAGEWLAALADRSDEALAESIKAGMLEVPR